MPGSKDASIAMHTADGSIFHFPHDPEPLGFSCRRGCVVKCSLVPDPLDNACGVVEFFKDGERVRVIPTPLPEGGLYGVVGMLSGGGERNPRISTSNHSMVGFQPCMGSVYTTCSSAL